MLEDNVMESIVKEMVKKFSEKHNVTREDIIEALGGKDKALDEDIDEIIQSLSNDAGIIVSEESPAGIEDETFAVEEGPTAEDLTNEEELEQEEPEDDALLDDDVPTDEDAIAEVPEAFTTPVVLKKEGGSGKKNLDSDSEEGEEEEEEEENGEENEDEEISNGWSQMSGDEDSVGASDHYVVDISSLEEHAIRILYDIINRIDGVCCDRVFSVAKDFETLLETKHLPLYTLDEGRPLKDLDFLGISIGYELCM